MIPTQNLILYISILAMAFSHNLMAQKPDTTINTNIEFLTDQLENIAQGSEENLDYSDLVDSYLYYSTNKINLNTETEKLLELKLINQIQLNNLKSYIVHYGQFYSIYELKNVPGFDNQTIQNLLPFITVLAQKKKISLNPSRVFKYGKHQIILRYQQFLEPSMGYSLPPDSAIQHPGSVYLGSPQAIYARYTFNYNNKVRLGFTLDKDAGEVFLKSNLSDSLQQIIGNKVNNLFDFFSAHLYVSDIGILKKVVLGDYHLEFGQGLTMWTGLAFGKSAEGVQIKRFAKGIRPNTSRNENRFFRGIASTIGWKGIELTGFYSQNKVDATLFKYADVDDEISSIVETGLHRTINELLKKDVLDINAFGGRLSYTHQRFNIGTTIFQTSLSTSLISASELYKTFSFSGNSNTNYGVDFAFNLNKLHFFGEFSASSNGGMAGLGGFNAFLSDRFLFSLFYHDYGKDYHNIYNNPISISSAISNERGLYFGFRALLYRSLSLSGYVDYFAFPWLKYGVDAPSKGNDYLLQLNYTPARSVNMYIRYRYKMKQENFSADYDYTDKLANNRRSDFRFFISYNVLETLVLKNRVDFVWYQKEHNQMEKGYMIYQDILYRPEKFPLEISFRYALFSTDSYNSRIYVYENDVLYAFTIPGYFYDGQRLYLMLRWKALKQLDIWLRVGRTTYFNRKTVGSGNDLIDNNSKTEIKVQMMVKL